MLLHWESGPGKLCPMFHHLMHRGGTMSNEDKSNESALMAVAKAVAYARVSSKEQEKEGFSIPAQQKLLQSYAQARRFNIAQEYVDIETAKQTGRTNFEEM